MANLLPSAMFAYEFFARLHHGQVYHLPDGDEAYINHLFRTACHFEELKLQIISLGHDSIEDCGISVDMLATMFNWEIARPINVLTRKSGEGYLKEYIPSVAKDPLARLVKLADLSDNIAHCYRPATLVSGMSFVIRERESQLERYLKAKKYLEEHA